jgi:hypothetical protein
METVYFIKPPANVDGALGVIQAIIDAIPLKGFGFKPISAEEGMGLVDCDGEGGLYPDNHNLASGEFRTHLGYFEWDFDNGVLTPPGENATYYYPQFSLIFTPRPVPNVAGSVVQSTIDAIVIKVDSSVVINHEFEPIESL